MTKSKDRGGREKVAFVMGGSGFIGRAVLEKYLGEGRTVLTTTRAASREAFLHLLAERGAQQETVSRCLRRRQLRVIYNFDLASRALRHDGAWDEALARAGVDKKEIGLILNLVTSTSGTRRSIVRSNVQATMNVIRLAKAIRATRCANPVFISMGSVAEKANLLGSPYARAKRRVRSLLERERATDFHVIAGLVKGRGDRHLPAKAHSLAAIMQGFPSWHSGFKVSVIGVEDVAHILFLLEKYAPLVKQQARGAARSSTIEVNISAGELTFGEVLENLVDEETARKLRCSLDTHRALERPYLFGYAVINRLFFPLQQLRVRIANFALLGALSGWPSLQNRINHHLAVGTAAAIRELTTSSRSINLALDPGLLCVALREQSRVFILKQLEIESLKEIVRQGSSHRRLDNRLINIKSMTSSI